MPSVFKIPRSPFWFAAYTDSQGKRVQKTTKQKVRAKALETCLAWARLEDAGRKGTLTEAHARRVVSEIVERATGEAVQFHTSRAWLAEWLAGKKGATGEKTAVKYAQVIKDFLGHLGDRADLALTAISPKDIRSFRDTLAKAGHSASTVNQTLRKVLSAPFAAAVRLGYLSVNPCAAVDALKSENVEKDVFTAEQMKAILKTAEGDWRGMILAGYYTGLRLKDLSDLEWKAVDIEGAVLKLRTGKTGAVVTIPLHDDLLSWLKEITRGIGKAPVFPSLAGKAGGGKSGLSSQFKKIMAKAKVIGRTLREAKGVGRTASSLSFHSLRHSFNSAMANAGVSQEMRQKLTGHASKEMNDRYTHHDIEGLRTAVNKVASIGAA